MLNRKILYFGDSIGIPTAASAIHVKNRSKLFNELGYEVHLVCNTEKNQNFFLEDEVLKYHYIPPIKGNGKLRGLKWNLDNLFGFFSYKHLKNYIENIRPNFIILYEIASIRLQNKIKKLCEKNNVILIIETTEWMEKEKQRGFFTNIAISFKNYKKIHLDKKCRNILPISKYLADNYLNQGCNVLCLPPTFSNLINKDDVIRVKDTRNNSNVRLIFAGSLSFKDYLIELIQALLILNKNEIKISFDIIGPSKEDILNYLDIDNLEEYGIYVHGRLPHDEVLTWVKKADFSVLLRQDKRYAKAGVSTKFCEAMKLGVPSICTKVGGTDLFVIDKVNGLLIDDNSVDSILKILNYIVTLTEEEILQMKLNAYDFANIEFSMDKHLDRVQEFFEKCNEYKGE